MRHNPRKAALERVLVQCLESEPRVRCTGFCVLNTCASKLNTAREIRGADCMLFSEFKIDLTDLLRDY